MIAEAGIPSDSGAPSPLSYRDASGVVMRGDAGIVRFVHPSYKANFDALISTGLYRSLVERGQLVSHEELANDPGSGWYRVLRPEQIPFISYPYEWSFSQLRDAALLTLDVHEAALTRGMMLKDATAFNVQFRGCRPVFIDTLSFELGGTDVPWRAYRQFCQHFLAPLALASYADASVLRSLVAFRDGYPLALAARQLPLRSYLSFGIATHLHAHARFEGRGSTSTEVRRMPPVQVRALIESLRNMIGSLRAARHADVWSEYDSVESYTEAGARDKMAAVDRVIETERPTVLWDIGANRGQYSRKAAAAGISVVALDGSHDAVDRLYRDERSRPSGAILPLVQDLSSPTPGTGWDGAEHSSLQARGPADLVLALALVHHLVFADRVPLPMIARFFARLARAAIVEFVPREDPQCQRVAATRSGEAHLYSQAAFEAAFAEYFTIEQVISIAESTRVLYVMRRRG